MACSVSGRAAGEVSLRLLADGKPNMARTTKPLSGGAKDKFLRGVVASIEGVPAETARLLTTQLTECIAEVRARREVYDRMRGGGPTAEPVETPRAGMLPQIAPKPPEPEAFDPFTFSAVAVLTKRGAAALSAELAAIGSVDHLRRLADAQHLSLDPAIADLTEMRAAILLGVERRIAERKAAAS